MGGSQEDSIKGMKEYMQLDKKKEEILEKIGTSNHSTIHSTVVSISPADFLCRQRMPDCA